jgi:hypothetical protein
MLSKLEGLLGFNERYIVGSLDNRSCEDYPGGKLRDSRTLGWKLIGCAVPRPICIISPTERVHASAWDRTDIYKGARRGAWLAAMAVLQAPPSPFEIATAALPRPPDRRRSIFRKNSAGAPSC